jgi:LysR family nitrogen assimilation transcriptional regulator
LKGLANVELSDLRYFVSIAETGSFTKSALQNNIAQSALSRRVRDIEADISVQLFYRNGRGVVLTEMGETFLTRARGILADMDALRQEMGRTAGVLDWTVTLAVPLSVGLILLAPLLSQVRTDHPQIKMRVLEGFSGHVADWLANGKIDLAVLYKIRSSALLDSEHLLLEDMYLISSTAAPRLGSGDTIALSQLKGTELALPSQPHGLRVLVDEACTRAQTSLTVAMELDTLPTICDLVAAGTIRTILPLTAVQADLAAGRVMAQKITDPVISRELILAHAPHRAAASVTKAAVRLIRNHIDRLVQSGLWVGRI